MYEFVIIMPLQDNAGNDTSRILAGLEYRLIDTFGGFTSTDARGAWKDDNGLVQIEPVRRYIVAADIAPNDAAEKVRHLAATYGAMLGQQSVYWRDGYGRVTIEDCADFVQALVKTPIGEPFGGLKPIMPEDADDAEMIPNG